MAVSKLDSMVEAGDLDGIKGLKLSKAKAIKALVGAAENCHVEITRHLVESFKISLTDYKKIDDPRRTLIHLAARKSCKRLVQYYLEHGVDIDSVAGDSGGPGFSRSTPLGIALYWGFNKLADFLISCGADINRYEAWGFSALGGAVANNNLEWVERIVEQGADINARCCGNDQPYLHAETKGYLDIAQYLLSKGAVDPNPLVAKESGFSISSIGKIGYESLESFVSDEVPEYEGRNTYSFGWIYEGLAAIELVPLQIIEMKQFLEKYSGDTLVYLHPWTDKETLNQVNVGSLVPFVSTNTDEYCKCRYRVTDQATGAYAEPEVQGMLRPGKRTLSKSDIDLFINRIVEPDDVDDWLAGSCAILNPYTPKYLKKVARFIGSNRNGELTVEVTKSEN